MTLTDHAAIWRDALRTAGTLDPQAIAAAITAQADNGLRAQRFDAQGGRTTSVACRDQNCHEGDPALFPHSHMVSNDPTGNTVADGRTFDEAYHLRLLSVAEAAFVTSAGAVLDFVSGKNPRTWRDVVAMNASIPPGAVQAGIDVDVERSLPYHIIRVEKAVKAVSGAAKMHLPRTPSADEANWTAGLADEDCCSWHLTIHRRYRRLRVTGTNICADCQSLALLLGQRPPQWLLEAEVDRDGKPRAWQQALGRCMDELGIPRDRAS